MITKIDNFSNLQLKKDLPNFKAGDTVKVSQKFKDQNKVKSQAFEGVVIAKKHGKGSSATFTVRRLVDGVWVEKIFPLHSPTIEKIEVMKKGKVRRAKLYYLRNLTGKKARIKRKEVKQKEVKQKSAQVA